MKTNWEEIQNNYNKAKECLWYSSKRAKDNNYWQRNEQLGYYHMWNAYHEASISEEKEDLLYARILAMVAKETQSQTNDYDRFHKYIKPAKEAYNRAIKTGCKVTQKEIDRLNFQYEQLAYDLSKQQEPYDEQVKHIKGFDKLNDLFFHDSKPVEFTLSGAEAKLKLKYYDTVVTLLFRDIYSVSVNTDPVADWVGDFCCYPCKYNPTQLFFDIGFYRIVCSEIDVLSLEYE